MLLRKTQRIFNGVMRLKYLFVLVLALAKVNVSCGGCSSWGWEYGSKARCYDFVPAPPGHTPTCVQPGLTYCEKLDHYPYEVVKHLISFGEYDLPSLLSDESREEFGSTKAEKPGARDPYGYGPNSLLNTDNIRLVTDEPIHAPQPYEHGVAYPPVTTHNFDISPFSNNSLGNGPRFNFGGFGRQDSWKSNGYAGKLNGLPSNTHSVTYSQPDPFGNQYYQSQKPQEPYRDWPNSVGPGMSYYNPHRWWQKRSDTFEASPHFDIDQERYRRWNGDKQILLSRSKRKTYPHQSKRNTTKRERSASIKSRTEQSLSAFEDILRRSKRQSGGSRPREPLCQTRSEFIAPQAALNKDGNWRYIVNMGNTMTQMVKTEVCISSQQCSDLCQLPLGYTSRCEQRFAQKRLIALDGNGQTLYADIFWFPTCCLCTISGN